MKVAAIQMVSSTGVADNIEEPQFTTAVGLMLLDSFEPGSAARQGGGKKSASSGKAAIKNASGVISRFFDRFKA